MTLAIYLNFRDGSVRRIEVVIHDKRRVESKKRCAAEKSTQGHHGDASILCRYRWLPAFNGGMHLVVGEGRNDHRENSVELRNIDFQVNPC